MAKGVTSKSRNKEEENKRREEQQKPHGEQKQTTQKQKPGQSKPQNETPVESKPATQEVAPKPTSTQIPTLEPKYASPEQIEEARDFGRRSLEMARAGQLDMSEKIPFTQGVEGYAEQYRIPELEETPSTTMPSDNYAPETRQDRTGKGYRPSPEDVSNYNKNPYKSEQRGVQSSVGPVEILGTRIPNSISEEGQRQVDKLSRRIASLQNTPMTGDAAIDEVTQRNNQEEIAKLQRQIDTIYNTDNSDNESNVERYLDPNYRLSKYEEQNAEQIFDEYLENNPKAKELYNTNDAAMSSLLAQRFTPEEAEEYARMVTLKNKTSDLGSAGLHMAQSMPFVRGLADKSMEAYEDQKGGGKKGEGSKGLDLSDYNYSAQLEQTQRQNPLASTAGNMGYQLGSYAAFAPLVEGIPVVGKAASALGGRFSNPAVAKAVESIVSGQAADTILDTLPNEIIPDIMEGNWRDLPKDIALNQLGNLAFNVAGEGIGALARNFVPSSTSQSSIDDVFLKDEDISDYLHSGGQFHAKRAERLNNGESIIIRSLSELKDKIKTIMNTPGKDVSDMKTIGFMRVGSNITDQINKLKNGIDTKDFFFQIEPSDLKHSINEHLTPKFKGDMPMSEDDIAYALSHLNDGTVLKVDVVGKNGRRAKILIPAEDGNYYTIQVISKGDGALSLKSLWKTEKNIPDTMGNPGSFKDSTSIPSQDALSDLNINQIDDSVKSSATQQISEAISKDDFRPLTFTHDGDTFILSKSTRDGEKWQLSQVDDTGRFVGHSAYKNDDELLSTLNNVADIDNLNLNGEMPTILDAPTVTIGEMLNNPDAYSFEDFERAMRTFDANADTSGATKEDIIDFFKSEIEGYPNTANTPIRITDSVTPPSVNVADEVAETLENTGKSVDGNADEITNDNVNAPLELTQNADGDVRERGMSQHIRAEDTPMKVEGVSDEVQADFVDNPDLYKQLKNADTQALADDIYNSGDQAVSINGKVYSGDVETKFRKLLGEKNPASLPLGHQLAKDYSAAGNHDMAAQIYRDMGQALTESGQFSQASVLAMMKNDPLTALQYAQRQLDAINQQGAKRFGDKWKDLSLTDDEIQAFNSIEPGNTDAIKALYDKIGARLGKEYPTTFMEKLLEGRKVAMLFNVRTNVRNVGANVPTLGLRWASDRVAALGEGLAHLINPNFKRTQAITGSGLRGRKLATEIFNSPQVKAMIDGTAGKYEIPELKNSLMNDRQVFKGTFVSKWINKLTNGGIEKVNKRLFGKEGVESGLETIRNATYKMLDLGDSPFVKENFIERLGSYIHAQGIKDVSEVPDEAIQTAWEEAMKATYKDDSWAVDMLRGIKGGIEKVPGVGKPLSQAVIPFLQAPGNIAARMVDYSPINATKGVIDIISGAANKSERAVRQGIDEAAKGLTGSGLILLGMKLREAGILTGDYSEDKDQKNFEKQNGFIPWALHIGDKYFQYDWAQPFAEPLIVGSLLQEAISNSDQYDSDILNHFGIEGSTAGTAIGLAKEGARASVNSWFNASPLQGLAELMSGGYNGTDIAQNIFDAGVSDFAGAFIPSLVNATAKTMDTTQRQTYDPSSKFGTFLNQQQAKIPGLSDNLPAKYDAWGEEMKYADSQGEAFAQRFAIPGDYGTDSNDPIDIEINNLFNSTQDAAVFPWTAANKVGDRKLNNREVSNYQRDMGQRNRELVEAFMNSDVYQGMDDASKVEALNTIYNTSKLITERDLFGKEIKDNSTYKKYIELFDEGGAQAVIDYQTGKIARDNAFIDAGLDKVYTSQSADAAYESNELPMYADYRQWLADNGKRDSLDLWESYKANNSQGETQSLPSVQEQSSVEGQRDANGKLIPVYTGGATSDPMSFINSSGVKINSAEAAWAKASAALPGITPNQFVQTWSAIDADGNGRPKKSEFVDYFNTMGYDENQAADILNGYYPNNYNPLKYSNGTWRQ